MFARTSLATGFAFIGLFAFGCTSEFEPEVQPQPRPEPPAAVTASAEYSQHHLLNEVPGPDDGPDSPPPPQYEEPAQVRRVLAYRRIDRTPQPSVVRWIGPDEYPAAPDSIQSTSFSPDEAPNLPAPAVAENPFDTGMNAPAQPIPKPQPQPVKIEAPAVATQVAPPVVVQAAPPPVPFDMAVQTYIDRVLNPGSAKAVRPAVPQTDSPSLDAAAQSLQRSSIASGISTEQKTALLSLLLEIDRVRRDTVGIHDVAMRLINITGGLPAPVVAQAPPTPVNPTPPPMPANPAPLPADYAQMLARVNAAGEVEESQEYWRKIADAAGNLAAQDVAASATAKPPGPEINAQQNFGNDANMLSAQPLTAVSFESVLEKLPTEARPLPNIGWDAFSIPLTHKWIKGELAGAQLQVSVQIIGVKLIRLPNMNDPDETVGWEVALTTKPESFHAFGIDTFNWPATWMEDATGKMWRGGEVRIPVTEDFAKQARLWRVGDTVILSGTVQDIAVEGGLTSLRQPCGRFTTIFQDVRVEKLIPQINRP
jgi:hypothetical protein